jgi:hypothetical protein
MSLVKTLKDSIAEKQKEIDALKTALKIIGGETNDSVGGPQPTTPVEQSAPAPTPLSAAYDEKPSVPAPSLPPRPVYTGPRCSACNGKMSKTAKIMRSGAYAEMWVCNDGSCNNESYA